MNSFQEALKGKMNSYVHLVYKIAKNFPKEELYASTSQLKRSSLSVILNYIEGFARNQILVRLNFLRISYGSLMESEYLLKFSLDEKYITISDYNNLTALTKEIGAMLWTEMKNIKA